MLQAAAGLFPFGSSMNEEAMFSDEQGHGSHDCC